MNVTTPLRREASFDLRSDRGVPDRPLSRLAAAHAYAAAARAVAPPPRRAVRLD